MANKNNKDFVSTGKPKVGGAIFVAPKGTTPIPTDATTALDATFMCAGYCSTDGLKNNNSRTTQPIKAWGGDTVGTATTDRSDTFTVTFIESLNAEVLKLVHGNENVTGTADEGITIKVNSKDLEEHIIVAELTLSGGILKRIVIPAGTITNVSEVSYTDTDAVGYTCTISAANDASGNSHYEYINKPQA